MTKYFSVFRPFLCLCTVISLLSGCTSSILSGDKKNDLSASSSRRATVNCKGLNLSNETLDLETTRNLVHCLNENHSIDPVEVLIDELNDDELGPVVSLVNENLMTNKKRLYDLNQSIKQLDEKGDLKKYFESLSAVLSNEDLIRSSSQLLGQVLSDDEVQLNDVVAKSIHLISNKINKNSNSRENLSKIFGFLITNGNLSAWEEIRKGLKLPVLPAGPSSEIMAKLALRYLKDKAQGDKALGKVLAWGVADGSLLTGLDQFFKSTKEKNNLLSYEHQTQSIEQLLKVLNIEHKKDWYADLTVVLAKLNNSIECMGDTKQIENGDMFVLNRLLMMSPIESPYQLFREEMLNIKAAAGFCALSDDILSRIKSFQKMTSHTEDLGEGFSAERRPVVALTQLALALKAAGDMKMLPQSRKDLEPFFVSYKMDSKTGKRVVYRYPENERYLRFLINWLGDDSENSFYNNISDIVAETVRPDRRVLANTLYGLGGVLNGLNQTQRKDLQDLMIFILEEKNELGGKSIYDVLVSRISNLDEETVAKFVISIRDVLDGDEFKIVSIFEKMRSGILFNNVNPALEILQVALSSEQNINSISKSILKLLNSPKSPAAIKNIAKLAKNGSLMELLQRAFDFLGSSQRKDPNYKNPTLVEIAAVPAIENEWNKSTRDESKWRPLAAYWPNSNTVQKESFDACSKLDFMVSLSEPTNPKWIEQLDYVSKCANAGKDFSELKKFITYANSSASMVKEGKPLSVFSVELAKDFLGTKANNEINYQKSYDELSDFLISAKASTNLKSVQKSIQYFSDSKYCGNQCATNSKQSVLSSGANLLGVFNHSEHQAIQGIFESVGTVLVDDKGIVRKEVSPAINDIRKLIDESSSTNLENRFVSKLKNRPEIIKKLIAAVIEHEKLPVAQVLARVNQLEHDYFNSVKVENPALKYQTAEQLKSEVRPLLERIADSKMPIVEKLLDFLASLDGTTYDPEWVSGWFQRMSGHVRAIPYYYPGQTPGKDEPKVKLVSDFDLLEIIATNADFTLAGVGQPLGRIFEDPNANFSVKYFTMLALSGDGLKAFVESLEAELKRYIGLVNNPVLSIFLKSEVKRRVRNLEVAAPLIRELFERTETVRHKNGNIQNRNDLGFLRDLFFFVLQASPKDTWANYERGKNSMDVIVSLAELGLLRATGPALWQVSINSNAVNSKAAEPQPVSLDGIFTLLRDLVSIDESGKRVPLKNSIAMFDFLLRKNISSQPVLRGSRVASFDDRFVFIGSLITTAFDWINRSPENKENSAANVYELIEFINRVKDQKDSNFISHVGEIIAEVLGKKSGTDFLIQNFDLLEDSLLKPKLSNFLNHAKEINLENIFNLLNIGVMDLSKNSASKIASLDLVFRNLNADSQKRFINFKKVMQQLLNDPGWINFKNSELDRIIDDLLDWIINSSGSQSLPPKVIEFTARHLTNGDFDAISEMIGKNPVLFVENIQFLSNQKYIAAMQDLMTLIRDNMKDNLQPLR